MDTPRPGGCLCGAVRYRLIGDPVTFYACHCTDCQRQTGSAFGLSMIVREQDLELVQGEPKRFEATMADGRVKRGRYCGQCAARLWGEPAALPGLRVLRPGTLDDPGAFTPIGHIWTRSARDWVPIPDDAVLFEGQPEDPMPLVRAWKGRDRAEGAP